jgi:hypothetical protein
VLCDVRLDDFASKRTEQRQRIRLAGADKPGIAHYIGCKDRGEPTSFGIASDRRALFIAANQTAVAGDIRRQNSRQSPFHARGRQDAP